LADKYEAQGLEVIGVSSLSRDQTMDDLETFMSEAEASFPIVHDADRSLFRSYAVGPIPAMALVKNGEVVFRNHPNYLTDEKLEDFLAAK
jgi:peroxiredoxin